MGPRLHIRSEVSCFGLAVARALERRHPTHTAKLVARTLSAQGPECTVRTAENILQGHLSSRTFTRLVDAYGTGLVLEALGIMAGGLTAAEVVESYIIENAQKAREDRVAARERWRGCRDQLRALRANNTSNAAGVHREVTGLS